MPLLALPQCFTIWQPENRFSTYKSSMLSIVHTSNLCLMYCQVEEAVLAYELRHTILLARRIMPLFTDLDLAEPDIRMMFEKRQ